MAECQPTSMNLLGLLPRSSAQLSQCLGLPGHIVAKPQGLAALVRFMNRKGELFVNLPFRPPARGAEKLAYRAKNPVRLSSLLRAPSGQILEAVRKLGLEGVVSKRVGSTYEPGERSGASDPYDGCIPSRELRQGFRHLNGPASTYQPRGFLRPVGRGEATPTPNGPQVTL